MNGFARLLTALHLIGIIVMAGTTMIDYLTFKTFWKLADQSDTRSMGLIPLMARYGVFIRVGGGIIILSGISLLILSKGYFFRSYWFQLKLLLFFLILLNGRLVGNTQGHKLREMVAVHSSDFARHTGQIRKRLNHFYPLQLSLFILIISISVISPDKPGHSNRLQNAYEVKATGSGFKTKL